MRLPTKVKLYIRQHLIHKRKVRGSIFGVLRYRSVQTPQTPSCDGFETQLSGSMMDLITEGPPIGPHNQSGNSLSRNPIKRRKSTVRASEDYGPGCLLSPTTPF